MRLLCSLAAAGLATLCSTSVTLAAPEYDRPEAIGVVGPESMRPKSPEPPVTIVVIGEKAPDFSYGVGNDQWLHLHDLLRHGHALLVFGATESDLRALEREHRALLDIGVVPVAIVDRTTRAASTLRRSGRFTIVHDERNVIADQFNLLDSRTHTPRPGWFVVHRSGEVRGLFRGGLPKETWGAIASKALAIPAPDTPVPARSR